MASLVAFQGNAFQNNAFQTAVFVGASPGDLIDYIFQFPDQGTYLRDLTVQQFAPTQNGVALLIYNPVETLNPRATPTAGNALVLSPQLAVSSVALSGFWALITVATVDGGIPFSLFNHANIQIVNDRTFMFARLPSVLKANIDVSHINIVINSFGVYVADGLQFAVLTLEDGSRPLLLEDEATPLRLEQL